MTTLVESGESSVPSSSNRRPYSVSELSQALKSHVEGRFDSIDVRGEISGLKVAGSGHAYFTLKDSDAVLDAVCWRSVMGRLAHRLEEGLEVVASGKLTTYPKRSRYQLVVEQLEPAGEGAWLRLLEERKRRLRQEGLFDETRKRPLPFLPRRIALITSERGAVLRDILHRLRERCPVSLSIFAVAVQGEKASLAIVEALKNVPRLDEVDVVIVARGGGSFEDLLVFSEESVVRAAAECPIPLVSAIGHETDWPLLDYVADLRAPTPSAAAEKVVPEKSKLAQRLSECAQRMARALQQGSKSGRVRVQGYGHRLQASLKQRTALARTRLANSQYAMKSAIREVFARVRERLLRQRLSPSWVRERVQRARSDLQTRDARSQRAVLALLKERLASMRRVRGLLQSLSYKNILARGYALARRKGEILRSARGLRKGDGFEVLLADESEVHALVDAKGETPQKPSLQQSSLQQSSLGGKKQESFRF